MKLIEFFSVVENRETEVVIKADKSSNILFSGTIDNVPILLAQKEVKEFNIVETNKLSIYVKD